MTVNCTCTSKQNIHEMLKLSWDEKLTICRKSMDTVDSLDIFHGHNGHLPWTQWTVWTMSMDTLDKVQWVHGQSPVTPARLDNVHGFSGHCPWTQRTVWTVSMVSVDNVHWVHGLSTDGWHEAAANWLLRTFYQKIAYPLYTAWIAWIDGLLFPIWEFNRSRISWWRAKV